MESQSGRSRLLVPAGFLLGLIVGILCSMWIGVSPVCLQKLTFLPKEIAPTNCPLPSSYTVTDGPTLKHMLPQLSDADDRILPAYAVGWRNRSWIACPSRYIVADGTFGQFTNIFYIFLSGLKLALMTNRTLVVPPTSAQYTGLASVFDLAGMAKKQGWCIVQAGPEGRHTGTLNYPITKGPLTPQARLERSLWLLERIAASSSSVVYVDAGCLFYFGNLGGSSVLTNHHYWPIELPHLHMRPEIQALGRAYIETKLEANYTAFHMRSLEGSCAKRLAANPVEQIMCSLTPADIAKEQQSALWKDFASCRPESGRLCHFMATDREVPERDRMFLKAGFITTDAKAINPRPHYINSDTLHYAVDVYILLHAGIFIGNPASTLSSLVASLRWHMQRPSILQWPPVPINHTII